MRQETLCLELCWSLPRTESITHSDFPFTVWYKQTKEKKEQKRKKNKGKEIRKERFTKTQHQEEMKRHHKQEATKKEGTLEQTAGLGSHFSFSTNQRMRSGGPRPRAQATGPRFWTSERGPRTAASAYPTTSRAGYHLHQIVETSRLIPGLISYQGRLSGSYF
jgi:hypothetical protein